MWRPLGDYSPVTRTHQTQHAQASLIGTCRPRNLCSKSKDTLTGSPERSPLSTHPGEQSTCSMYLDELRPGLIGFVDSCTARRRFSEAL